MAATKRSKYMDTAAKLGKLKKSNETLQRGNDALEQKLEAGGEAPLKIERKVSAVTVAKHLSRLFNEAEQTQNHKAEEPTEETLFLSRKGKGKKLPAVSDVMPVEDIVLSILEEHMRCECGAPFHLTDENIARQEMELVPGQSRFIRFVERTYACENCKNSGIHRSVSTVAPSALLKKSNVSVTTVAYILTMKYSENVSLAMLERMYAKEGIRLSAEVMANWIVESCDLWLKPLYKQMKSELLTRPVIEVARAKAQLWHGGEQTSDEVGHMWVYASHRFGKNPIRVFEYQPERGGKRPETFLKGFDGCLMTDVDLACDRIPNATHCICWQRLRDMWRSALPEKMEGKGGKAADGLKYCNKILALDEKYKAHSNEECQAQRINVILPVVEEFALWLNTVKPEGDEELAAAVSYAEEYKETLSAFLECANVPATNHFANWLLQPFGEGGDWLFSNTSKGAQASAIVYSLIQTAGMNGWDAYHYLQYVLLKLVYYGRNPSREQLTALMPWHPNAVRYREDGVL